MFKLFAKLDTIILTIVIVVRVSVAFARSLLHGRMRLMKRIVIVLEKSLLESLRSFPRKKLKLVSAVGM
jgi:hypothetical protein